MIFMLSVPGVVSKLPSTAEEIYDQQQVKTYRCDIIIIIIIIIIVVIVSLSRVTVAAELRLSVWPSCSHIHPTLMQPPLHAHDHQLRGAFIEDFQIYPDFSSYGAIL